jgi:hypothetical protein
VLALAAAIAATAVGASGADHRAWADAAGTGFGSGRGDHRHKPAAHDLRQHGVTLNLACPGYHAMHRLKVIGGAPDGLLAGDPADFGKIVAFLCSEPGRIR